MRKIIVAGLLLAPLIGSGAANASCPAGYDCGTVRSTGFGQQCAWVRIESSVVDRVTVYGLPYGLPAGGPQAQQIAGIAKIGRPLAVKPGALFKCQDIPGGAPQIVSMSNDPAEQ